MIAEVVAKESRFETYIICKGTNFDLMSEIYDRYKVPFWLGVVILQQGLLWTLYDGTADDGDSVSHYLHSRYAFEHPWLFLHLWAKPVLVTLSAPFAQFGMDGMKLFNSICALCASYFSFRLAKEFKVPRAELCIPLLMFMPKYLYNSLSGLTEPLSSMMVVGGLLLLSRKKFVWATLVFSFLPFARPEGMFFLVAAGLYLIYKKEWKLTPLLLTSYVTLSLVGYLFFDQDLLWLFNKDGYARLTHKYETFGDWTHFLLGLRKLYGYPILFLFSVGVPIFLWDSVRQWRSDHNSLLKIVSLAGIAIVIALHAIFHIFSIFSSFGLLRPLMIVSPLAAITSLYGLNGLTHWISSSKISTVLITALMGLIMFFPYSGNKFAYSLTQDFGLTAQQLNSKDLAEFIKSEYPQRAKTFHNYPTLNMQLDQDPFDWRTYAKLNEHIIDKNFPPKSLVIWDDWYVRVDGRVDLESMDNHLQLIKVREFSTKDKWNATRKFVVYKTSGL